MALSRLGGSLLALIAILSIALADTGGDTGEPVCEDGQPMVEGDFDGDGLSDEDELSCGSDPCAPDTDLDGFWDGAEIADVAPCGPDTDGDGITDLLDPDSPASGGATEDTIQAESGKYGLAGGRYTGGACSVGAASPGLLPAMLILGFLFRRRWWPAALGALSSLPAQGQELNIQRLEPSMDSPRFVWMEEGRVGDPGLGAGVLSHYSRDPFVVRSATGDLPLIAHLWTTDLGVHWNHGRVSTGAGLPIHGVVLGHPTPRDRWIGDASLSAKVALLDEASGPLGLAATGRLGLPTGNGEGWLGAPGVNGAARVALTGGEAVRLGLNMGVVLGPRTDLGDLSWGTALSWRVGASTSLTEEMWVSAELDSAHHLIRSEAPGAHPLEGLVSLGWQRSQTILTAGGGAGLSQGVGAPLYRGILGLSWLPGERQPPTSVVQESPLPAQESAPRPVVQESQPPPAPQELAEQRSPQTILRAPILFGLGSASLTPESVEQLEEMALVLLDHPGLGRVEIRGHAARQGEQNTQLSQARAEAVMIWLVQTGVPGPSLSARGYGNTRSAHVTDPDARERVELHLVEQDPPSAE